MNRIFLLWILSVIVSSAFTGKTISPVVVHVVDEAEKPVPGATVRIANEALMNIIKNELDPNSDFKALATAAALPVKTNSLGMALSYCGGGWLPTQGGGTISSLRGTVLVNAPEFENANFDFKRDVSSSTEGATELVLMITIKMKKIKK
jgi:hypothetical protein